MASNNFGASLNFVAGSGGPHRVRFSMDRNDLVYGVLPNGSFHIHCVSVVFVLFLPFCFKIRSKTRGFEWGWMVILVFKVCFMSLYDCHNQYYVY